MGTYAKYAPISESGLSGLLGDKYVRSTRFATISSGTSGSVTLPPNSQVVLDDFGGTTDAIITTVQGGKPTFESATTSAGVVIATTFDSAGNYVLSGTPSAYPVAIVYRVQQQLKFFDSTSSNILGMSQIATIPDITGLANKTLSNLDSPTAVNQPLNLTVGGTATVGGAPFLPTNPEDLITQQALINSNSRVYSYTLAPKYNKDSTILLVSIPEAFYVNLPFLKVYQNGNLLVYGTDYTLAHSDLVSGRQLYNNNSYGAINFFDRVYLNTGDDVNSVTVVYEERYFPVELSIGIDIWNFDTNEYVKVDTTGINGNTFCAIRVPRIIKRDISSNKYFLTGMINSPPNLTVDPTTGVVSQDLSYDVAGGGSPITQTRVFPNMAFIRELPLTYNLSLNGYVVEIWCMHSSKNYDNYTPNNRRRSRLTPAAIWSLQNTINMGNLIYQLSLQFRLRVFRKGRNYKFRLRRISDNAVTPWMRGSMHVTRSKRIVVQGIAINNLVEVYYRD